MAAEAKNNLPPGKIEFISSHHPPLPDGDYTLTVTQTIEAGAKIEKETFTVKRYFSVLGPRTALDPQDVQVMFPPAGSLGENSNVLPHIILKRNTLPWERLADHNQQDVPWLALILFNEAEAQTNVKTITLTWAELKNQSAGQFPKVLPRGTKREARPADQPYLIEEYGQHDDDKLTVIEVDKSTLQAIMPTTAELKWLTHVRQGKDEKGQPQGDEMAVIISNRLPEPGQLSTVHLVSVEGRYHGNNFDLRQAGDKLRLVSLKSWRFACVAEKQSFKGLLTHLNHQLVFNLQTTDTTFQTALSQGHIPAALHQAFVESKHSLSNQAVVADHSQWQITDANRRYLIGSKGNNPKIYNQAGRFLFEAKVTLNNLEPAQLLATLKPIFAQQHHPLTDQAVIKAERGHWWLKDSQQQYLISQEGNRLYVFHQDLDAASTLRLPPNKNPNAEQYLAKGCVALPHVTRQGNQTVSWYHGPLVPGNNITQTNPNLPVRAADQLVYYSPHLGMFDISYAAAWELGRLLALQSKDFSVNLFNWKRSHAQSLKNAENELTHLPFTAPTASLDMPATVTNWFEQTSLLAGVPFNYLVPDEQLLPPESLRFFQLDWLWVECLLDGAFSIGRVLKSDHQREANLKPNPATNPHGQVSGFLLRSDVVSGWPDLQIDAYDQVVEDNRFLPDSNKLELLRLDRLSKNVLICLFKGTVETVDIHQKPEGLHFGLSRPDDTHPNGYYKELRDRAGVEQANLLIDVSWRDKNQIRVVDIDGAANDISGKLNSPQFTSAQFALEMIEGVQKVRFVKRVG